MKKLESTLVNMLGVLTGIAVVSACMLTLVYGLTTEKIEEAKLKEKKDAIYSVLSNFDSIEDEKIMVNNNTFIVHKAYLSKKFIGAAVETFSKNGFGGPIKVMVGFDIEGNIIDYVVLEQKETPGLGTQMEVWFKTEKNNQSIKGKNPAKDNLYVTRDGGVIDAITASTITSRAFLESIRLAYNAYAEANDAISSIDASSGASGISGATVLETNETNSETEVVSEEDSNPTKLSYSISHPIEDDSQLKEKKESYPQNKKSSKSDTVTIVTEKTLPETTDVNTQATAVTEATSVVHENEIVNEEKKDTIQLIENEEEQESSEKNEKSKRKRDKKS